MVAHGSAGARSRLGAGPLRLLFEQSAGPIAGPGTPGAFWRGLRLVSLDATTLDVQDTEANWGRTIDATAGIAAR